ncbi:hypothetical protein Tco_0226163 [Tanacetum coccineum]
MGVLQTRLTPTTPIPPTAEANDIILQDTIQLSLAEQKIRDEIEAKQNVEKVKEHLIAKEIEKLVEGSENVENVEDDSTTLRLNDNPNDLGTRPETRSNKESPKTGRFKRYKSFFDELQGRYGYLFEHLKARFMPRKKFNVLAQHLQEVKELTKIPVPVYVAQGLILEKQQNQTDVAKMITDAIQITCQLQQDDLPIWIALKYKFERLHVSDTPCRPSTVLPRDQDDPHDDTHPEGENNAKSEPGPSTSGNQEQLNEFDFWMDSYATNDEEIPTEKVSQELMEEMSQTVDESKLQKVVNKMLRQRCTSGDEHQYHIDQMQNFLKIDIKGNSGPDKIMLSLHKFPAVIFPDDDIEERTSRWELGHEHKFIAKIVARRANGSIVSITESDYKNLNKNDIEDMYLLVVNNKVDDYAETGMESYQQKVNLTAPTITFPGIKKYKVFSIVFEPVVLEWLKSNNNDVKHRYVTPSLSNEDAEYLQLFEEEIEERFKHRDQMRR